MESRNNNQSIEEARRHTLLPEAWSRFVDNSYTLDDLRLLLDSVENDEHLQECHEVLKRIWNEPLDSSLPVTEKQKRQYKREADRIFAEYMRNRKASVPSQALVRLNRFRKVWYAAAAAILLVILIPATYYYYSKHKTEQLVVQYVETFTQCGEIRTIFLPDGTKVTLNAGSALKYPQRFSGDERPVELQGEALFDVTSDPEHPFTVKTEHINIRVKGTVFDVKAYQNDILSSVSVVSGKVEVGFAEGKTLLVRNQQVIMDPETGSYEQMTIDADKYLLWTNGILYFHKTPVQAMVNVFNRHYPQMKIELAEGDYSSILISGEYQNTFTAEELLNTIIYITGLKCKKTGTNKYTLFNDH